MDSQDRTTSRTAGIGEQGRREQIGQDWNMTERTVQRGQECLGQERWDRTAGTGNPKQESCDSLARTGKSRQERKERTART